MQGYRAYLLSPAWRTLCRQVRKRDRGFCCGCHRRCRSMHVHHLTYQRLGHEELDDLQLLCAPCHKRMHKIEIVDGRPRASRRRKRELEARQRAYRADPQYRIKRLLRRAERAKAWKANAAESRRLG